MEEVFKADVFFFITAIAVIIVTVLLCIILYHVLKAVKGVRRIIDRVEVGSEMIAEDITNARSTLLNTSIASVVSGIVQGDNDTRSIRASHHPVRIASGLVKLVDQLGLR